MSRSIWPRSGAPPAEGAEEAGSVAPDTALSEVCNRMNCEARDWLLTRAVPTGAAADPSPPPPFLPSFSSSSSRFFSSCFICLRMAALRELLAGTFELDIASTRTEGILSSTSRYAYERTPTRNIEEGKNYRTKKRGVPMRTPRSREKGSALRRQS
jgi:hypothetical protein